VRANAGALTELRLWGGQQLAQLFGAARIEALLRAAPLLRCFETDLDCQHIADADALGRLLRNERVFAPLRVRKAWLRLDAAARDEASVRALAASLAAHASLQEVTLQRAPLRALPALDAVVDAALAVRLHSLSLIGCALSAQSAPALARLLRGGALTALHVWNSGGQLLDEPSAALLGDALRANSTLTALRLDRCGLWHQLPATVLLLNALTGHGSLRALNISHNDAHGAGHEAAAGAALSALVAANAPALEELNVSFCRLGDASLGPLVDALPLNTHLRALSLADNDCIEACARDRLLPAVRANASLWQLQAGADHAFAREGGGARPGARHCARALSSLLPAGVAQHEWRARASYLLAAAASANSARAHSHALGKSGSRTVWSLLATAACCLRTQRHGCSLRLVPACGAPPLLDSVVW
jgi:hypothetical protein